MKDVSVDDVHEIGRINIFRVLFGGEQTREEQQAKIAMDPQQQEAKDNNGGDLLSLLFCNYLLLSFDLLDNQSNLSNSY